MNLLTRPAAEPFSTDPGDGADVRVVVGLDSDAGLNTWLLVRCRQQAPTGLACRKSAACCASSDADSLILC